MTTHYLSQANTLDQKLDEQYPFDIDLFPLRQFHDHRHARNATYSPLSSNASQAHHYLFLPPPPPPSSFQSYPSIPLVLQESKDSNETIGNTISKQSSRNLRFEIVLEAATAVTQRAEETTITYLNRGQSYGVKLSDKDAQNEIITSTISITFHSSSHRRTAENYWKSWIHQQKQEEPRAIDLDTNQSEGLSEVSFPSFDKISFNWNGRFGARIFVRFNCLSTDFSRIKGVKGIPLRAQMESHVPKNLGLGRQEINEACFCKVKLFRDKGAERKNKDDAKQISKQLEKVYGKADEKSLPLMYNVSLPYSVLQEIPTPLTSDSSVGEVPTKKASRYHTRIMTAPAPSLIYRYQPDPLFQPKEEVYEYLPDQKMASLPTIDTNPFYAADDLSDNTKDTLFLQGTELESPPLTADTMYTLCAIQPTQLDASLTMPSSLHDLTVKDPTSLLNDPTEVHTHFDLPFVSEPIQSIYDVFTPEEIQHYPLKTPYAPSDDYFCSPENPRRTEMSILQQQLQQHNQKASHIILSSNSASDRLLSTTKKKKRRSSKLTTDSPVKSVASRQDVHKKRRCST
ncbi:CP2 transcription factor-domain-containing protein [Blakeslea trispora]|nr:CP2 transcription factor-domain-containing protein [Blakeslea trispora]